MEKSNYNCGGGDASRGRGGGSGCGRGVSSGGRGGSGGGRGVSSGGRGGYGGGRAGNNYQKCHQGQYQTGGAAGNSGGGGGNNCQQHNQGHRSGGYGRRRRRRGEDRSGTQMGTNPPPAQPWEDRPVQGAKGETQMGINPPPVQGDQGGTQWPESATGQGAGATGGRGAWSVGPPHVAGRGSWASAVRGGAGAGLAQRGILFLFLFLVQFYQTLPKLIVFAAENGHHTRLFLENQGGDVHKNISPGQFWTQKLFTPSNMISAIMRILEQASQNTTYVIYDEHNFTSNLLQKLIYQLCFTFARCCYEYMLPSLPMGDEWRCSLLLQLRHQLLSHHHRIHLQLHLTISSDFLCSMQ